MLYLDVRTLTFFTALTLTALNAPAQSDLHDQMTNELFGGLATEQTPAPPEPTQTPHDPADEVDFGDGLIIIDLKVGDGPEVVQESLVTVDYAGWLSDNGELFDTSKKREGEPLVTRLPGRLIEGWNRGLIGLREGGTRKMIVPAELAYGERGSHLVPPNADLIFEVHALAVLNRPTIDASRDQHNEDGTIQRDLAAGEGATFDPHGFAQCNLSLWNHEGKIVGSTHESAPITVSHDDPRYWVKYALGMAEGGKRVVEIDDPRPESIRMQDPNPAIDDPHRWTILIEIVGVTPPIVQTPHDPEDEIVGAEGLRYVDLVEGDEDLPDHAIPVINYSGWLEDGRLFDSTYKPGRVPEYASKGLIIRGWELGLEGVRVGTKRKLILPPELGYGSRGFANLSIPPDAVLIYEIDVIGYEMPLFLPVDGEDFGGGFDQLEEDTEGADGG